MICDLSIFSLTLMQSHVCLKPSKLHWLSESVSTCDARTTVFSTYPVSMIPILSYFAHYFCNTRRFMEICLDVEILCCWANKHSPFIWELENKIKSVKRFRCMSYNTRHTLKSFWNHNVGPTVSKEEKNTCILCSFLFSILLHLSRVNASFKDSTGTNC